MKNKLTATGRRWMLAACMVMLCVGSLMVAALPRAQEDETTRKLWDEGFLQKRPAGKSQNPTPSAKRPVYRRVTPAVAETQTTADATGDAKVGITVWRLRPPALTDDKEVRMLVYRKGSKQKVGYTPERVEADTPLLAGEYVRLSIEVPRTGFLYVIDREQYDDGTLGEPHLIFPTLEIRDGDNAVTAGRVIEVPSQDDDPPYFELEAPPNNPHYAGEVLTMLVTKERLGDLKIGREPLKLSEAQVAAWEKKWGARTERLDLSGWAGKKYTKAEKAAGANPKQLLTRDDALPQTIYFVAADPSSPLLVKVPLKISKTGPKTQNKRPGGAKVS